MTALLAVFTAGIAVAVVLSLREEAPAAQASERTVTVERGVIETIVSGSGNLEASRQADLDFGTSGRLRKLYVKEGQHVSKGELLARIDDRSQRVAVARAQADLVDAQDALESALEAESNTETASTETVRLTLVSAQVTPTPTPEVSPTGTPGPSATPTPSVTPSAPRPSVTPTPTAQSQPPSGGGSGSESTTPQGSGSTMSVESAQASIESAELALDEAEDDLDETRLRAPMAGTIASISGAVGDTVGSGSASSGNESSEATSPLGGDDTSAAASTSFITLVALSRLKMEVALSEADIGKVETGQSVTVSVNAASGEQVAGEVTEVGVLSSSSTSGSVSYPVVVTLDQSTEGIRAGMSATADIVVDRASGLAVPSQALRGTTVTVERDGGRATQRVQTGVVGESMTEVVSGLEAGDKVIVTSTSALQGATANQQQTPGGVGQGRGGFGGGGGFGGPGGGFGGGGPPGGGGFGGGPPGGP